MKLKKSTEICEQGFPLVVSIWVNFEHLSFLLLSVFIGTDLYYFNGKVIKESQFSNSDSHGAFSIFSASNHSLIIKNKIP